MTDRQGSAGPPRGPRHVLIVGVSARAMAESAVRAGYRVSTVDAYADLDLAAIADTTIVAPYSAAAAAAAARGVAADIVCYVSNLENHPEAVGRLSRRRGRLLRGNGPEVLTAVRTPRMLSEALAAAGIRAPRTRATAPRADPAAAAVHWLLKPRASGGGHGIRPWRPGEPVRRRCVLQERIAGPAGSITFVADGRRCLTLGVSRQLVGDRRFGAPPFRYCGNILAPPGDRAWGRASGLAGAALAAAAVVTRAFGLRGVNGLDFIVCRGCPVPIEVNPRYTAAMELVERRDGYSVFAAHVAGCARALDAVEAPRPGVGASGKAIVFARRNGTAGDTTAWLTDEGIRDVPPPGTPLARGAPICTVLAAASTSRECYQALVGRAERVYRWVEHGG